MNKVNSFKLFMCCVILATMPWLDGKVCFGADQAEMEALAQNDPFEMINPIPKTQMGSTHRATTNMAVVEPDLFVETVILKFLRAESFEDVADKLVSGFGAVSVDATTNSLIICDGRERLDRIVAQIRKADKTPEQIMIEVVIVDVQLDDDTELGVDWTHLFGGTANSFSTVFANTTSHSKTFNQTLLPSTLSAGGAFGIVQNNIMVVIKALQQVRNVEILSSPRVLVVSGQEAYIETVEEIPYIELSESSGGSSGESYITSTEFKEAGITLKVKATLTDGGKILMAIDATQSINTGEAGIGDTTVPIVDKRNARTSLYMKDGQIVVMGGLRKKETTITEDKVPMFGDLPVIGFLFSDEQTVVKNSELLILISPHVYKDEFLSVEEETRFETGSNLPSLHLPVENNNNPVKAIDQRMSSAKEE